MGTVYLRQDLERTVISEADQELKEFVNEAVKQRIQEKGLQE